MDVGLVWDDYTKKPTMGIWLHSGGSYTFEAKQPFKIVFNPPDAWLGRGQGKGNGGTNNPGSPDTGGIYYSGDPNPGTGICAVQILPPAGGWLEETAPFKFEVQMQAPGSEPTDPWVAWDPRVIPD